MDRSEFLKLFGAGSVLACAGCLSACTSNDDPAPTNIDFTLDLTLPENAALKTVGGSLVKSGVIVVKLTATTFTAVSVTCTHEHTAVNYVTNSQVFLCPNHQSKFDSNGNVLNGPATKALKKYNTTLTGDSLRVTS